MFSKHLKQVLRNRETLFHANRKEKSFRFQQKKHAVSKIPKQYHATENDNIY